MGTRARIGILEEDGTVTSIYVHNDGYPEHVGVTLCAHYRTDDAARVLLALGDMSSLGEDVDSCRDYRRMRGQNCPARRHPATEWPDSGHDYAYLRREGEWVFCGRDYTSFRPV